MAAHVPDHRTALSGTSSMTDFLQGMWDRWIGFWPYFVTFLDVGVALVSSVHAILYKRDARAAVAWVGLIWLVPFLGALLYLLFGVNRIRRRARSLRPNHHHPELPPSVFACAPSEVRDFVPDAAHLTALAEIVASATGKPLLKGNRITTLHNGDEAYSAMIQEIDDAKDSVLLSTYIFDNDRAGERFLDAFERAIARRVEVRVLIDDLGARYSWPSVLRPLRRAGVRVGRFLPKLIPVWTRFANLRNHRKVMVVDGRVGFTGGMNIRESCLLELNLRYQVRDLHFRVEGPAVAHLQEVLVDDWAFATGELLQGDRWFPPLQSAGQTLARGIVDGPDEDFERLRLTLLGAVACARSSVMILTPYFLPDSALVTSLNVAAMRKVDVDILLPAQNNLRVVQWASTAQLWQVLQRGCRVWLTPPPFDHTKLIVVDGAWVLLGSSNWDARSLRLNFEFDLECYDPELGASLQQWVRNEPLRGARPVTLAQVDGRILPVRIRGGVARLLSPYL
jgi:cardiolipin synthase